MTNGSKPDTGKLGQAARVMQEKGSVQKLLQSEDTKRMMDMLSAQGGVQTAAKAAAAGDPTQLMGMMKQLMSTKEGADLVERITKQAQQSGL